MGKRNLIILSGLCLTLTLAGCTSVKSDTVTPTTVPTATIAPATPTTAPTKKPTATPTPAASAGKLKGYMNLVRNYNFDAYANPEIVDEPMKHAEELIASGTATQED